MRLRLRPGDKVSFGPRGRPFAAPVRSVSGNTVCYSCLRSSGLGHPGIERLFRQAGTDGPLKRRGVKVIWPLRPKAKGVR